MVGKWQEKAFDFGAYKDRYREKVKQAIEAKEKGIEVSPPEEEEPEVINLMDALQRSIASTRGRSDRASTARTKAKRHETNGHAKKSKRISQSRHRA